MTSPSNVLGPGVGVIDSRSTIFDGGGSGGSDSGGGHGADDAAQKSRHGKVSALGLAGGIPLGGSSLLNSSRSGLGESSPHSATTSPITHPPALRLISRPG